MMDYVVSEGAYAIRYLQDTARIPRKLISSILILFILQKYLFLSVFLILSADNSYHLNSI